LKKITTIEEYDDNGKMIKKIVVEEDGVNLPAYIPFAPSQPRPDTTPWPGTTWRTVPGIDWGNKIT
jgi:hypothetical protein